MKIQYNLSSGNMEYFHIESSFIYQGNLVFWGHDTYSDSSKFFGFMPQDKLGLLFEIGVIETGETVDLDLGALNSIESFTLAFMQDDSLRIFGKPSEYVLEDGYSVEEKPYETIEFDNLSAFDFFGCYDYLPANEIQRRIGIAVEDEDYELAGTLNKLINVR